MQDKVFSYSDPFEREFMCAESALDIEFARCNMAYEYAENLYNLKIQEADLKVMSESGTYEELDALYEDAAQQTGEKKKGVIASLFEAITKFISNIFASLAKLFGGKDDKEVREAANSGKLGDVSVEGDPGKVASVFLSTWQQVKKFCTPAFTKQNKNGERVFSITRTMFTALAAAGLGFAGKKLGGAAKNAVSKRKTTKAAFLFNMVDKVKDALRGIGKASKDLGDDADKTNAGDTESSRSLATVLRELAHTGGEILKEWTSPIKEKFNKIKSGKDDGASAEETDNQSLGDEEEKPEGKHESAMDDLSLDLIYNEMDYMESVDYNDSCEEILDLLKSM